MKNSSVIVFAAILTMLCTINAGAYTIDDKYYGGTPTDNKSRDLIGDKNYYDISGMDVSFSGKTMTVDVFSTFFSQLGSKKIWSDRTKLGDLFVSTTGWNPKGNSVNHYSPDKYGNTGTNWNYAVVLDNHVPSVKGDTTRSGNVSLYALTDGNVILSSAPNGATYRKGQMVQFAPGKNVQPLATGTWEISDMGGTAYDKLSFVFDSTILYANTPIGTNDWGLHWAATCANDVIEGKTPIPSAPVPEPSTIVLTAMGLLGTGYYLRKRRT